MTSILHQAGIYAVAITAATEALRSKFPAIDGWKTVLTVACIAILICAVSMPTLDRDSAWEAFRTAALAAFLAMGGNAWVVKIAEKAGGE